MNSDESETSDSLQFWFPVEQLKLVESAGLSSSPIELAGASWWLHLRKDGDNVSAFLYCKQQNFDSASVLHTSYSIFMKGYDLNMKSGVYTFNGQDQVECCGWPNFTKWDHFLHPINVYLDENGATTAGVSFAIKKLKNPGNSSAPSTSNTASNNDQLKLKFTPKSLELEGDELNQNPEMSIDHISIRNFFEDIMEFLKSKSYFGRDIEKVMSQWNEQDILNWTRNFHSKQEEREQKMPEPLVALLRRLHFQHGNQRLSRHL